MPSSRWERVQDALWAALELEPPARKAFITGHCAGDSELLAEVCSLLEAHEAAGPFLGGPLPSDSVSPPGGAPQVRRLFQEAADLTTDERTSWIHAAPPHDVSMRREVVALLRVYERGVAELAGRDPPPRPDPFLGRTISHYQIFEKLGEGGMGVVYRARDTRLGRVVALKFPAPRLAGDADARERVLREARAASALDHVNICTIHEIGETDAGQLFIAMACYAGETLEEKLRRTPLPLDEVLGYAVDVAQGLSKAHEHGIAHRDIKPANVMVTEDGVVKLLDFGLAEAVDERLTEAGVARATPAYMSPEQARGKRVDHRSDIWSLGVVLYEMLTGCRPFRGEHAKAVIDAILHAEPESVTTRRPEAPALLEQIVAKSLARRVADRYDDADALLRDLRQVRDDVAAARFAGGATAVGTAHPVGRPSGDRLLAGGERVQITAVAWTLAGGHDSGEEPGPEDLHRLLQHAHPLVMEVVQRHGGMVQRVTAGQIVALFGIPTPREDDCIQAARAALALAARLRESAVAVGAEVAVRSGLDTGMVLVRRPRRAGEPVRVTGSPLRAAVRLARHAGADEVLASPDSRGLLARFFETEDGPLLRSRGMRGDETPARVLAESMSGHPMDAADLTAFTGRDKQLETLCRCLERAIAGDGQLVTLTGEAGLGKSRLLDEFRGRIDGVTVLQGHCSSRGSLQSFQPFIEALQDHFRVGPGIPGEVAAERVIARIRQVSPELDTYAPLYLHLLSLSSEAQPLPAHLEGESLNRVLLTALTALFTLGARQKPLVLLLEDWHWSDEGSRKVLDQLVELISSYPILVVLTCRPDYAPAWVHAAHQTTVRLRPLEEGASKRIVKSTLRANDVPDSLGALLHERTGGNPFFLEEICRTLLEEGTVRIDTGRLIPVHPLDRLPLPNTVQAVIRTRLHRLDGESRTVLRMASVVGRAFTRDLLQQALGHGPGDDAALERSLEALRSAGLIHRTHVLPEATYEFKHALTWEVAYDGLLQHQRRQVHGRVGEAIEQRFAGRMEEHAEVLAHHFGGAQDWRRVVRFSRIAAERSFRLGQLSETLALFEQARKALDRLPEDAERQQSIVELLLRRERVYEAVAGHEEQQAAIDELFALLGNAGDPRTLAEIHIRQGDLHILRGRFEQAEEAINEALKVSRAHAHGPGEQKALRCMGFLRWHQDRHDEAVSINEELVALDRERGDTEALGTDLLNLLTVLRRLREFDRGLMCVEELLVLSEQLDDPVRQLPLNIIVGEFYRDLGDHSRALFYTDRAIALTRQHQHLGSQTHHLAVRAQILLDQGRVEESIQCYRDAIGVNRSGHSVIGAVGPAQDGPVVLAKLLQRLGDILVALQREEEALPYLEEAVSFCVELEDPETEASLRRKVAIVHEGQGRAAAAQAEWEQVRALCQGGADVAGEYEALEGLGRMARHQGNLDQAVQYYREALRFAEQTGNTTRQGALHNSLGILAWKAGGYAQALTHYEQGLRLFETCGDPGHAGLMLNSIGATLHKLERPEEAIRRLEEAIRLHRQIEQRQLEAHALAVLGDVYFGMDRHEEALPCYLDSLRLRPELGDRRGEGWMLHRLARSYAAQGSGERSRNTAARAALIAAEVGDEELTKTCRLFTGETEP
jgi:tetratricopeptide (TPR) repeat protein/class 3 adenylate cyclase